MKRLTLSMLALLVMTVVLGFAPPNAAHAAGPAPIDLLSAGNFVVLAKSGITNTGSHTSRIIGNIGSSPITAAAMDTVFCSEMTGTIYGVDVAYTGNGITTCFSGGGANKTLVDNAVGDMGIAYTAAAGRTGPDGTNLYNGNLGGQTFAPGLYTWTTNVTIPTNVILSGGANDVWIFQIAGNLDIASGGSVATGSKVLLAGGAQASNIFWQVGGGTGATLGTYSTFNGTILSATQVIIQTGAVLNGRALAQTQVTLDATIASVPVASPPPPTPPAPATLHIIKTVVIDTIGIAVASDFSLHVKSSGNDVNGSPAVGMTSPGRLYTLTAGTYVISEDTNTAYTQSFSGDCDASGNITLVSGADKTCTITNTVVASTLPPAPSTATLHVVKAVINNNSGTALASAFTLNVKLSGTHVAGSPAVGIVSPGRSYTLATGTYIVSEDAFAGYVATMSGDCDASGSITLIAGIDKTCTITNDDIASGTPPPTPMSTINIVKKVINDNGRTKVVADFPLFVNGTLVVSGATNTFAAPATYTVTETGDLNYVTTFSGDCDASGNISLAVGDHKSCVITNNDRVASMIVQSSLDGSTSTLVPPALSTVPTLPDTGVPPEEKTYFWVIGLLVGVLMLAALSLVFVNRR